MNIYEHQQALDYKHLEKYAEDLGLNLAKFNNEMSSDVHAGCIREEFLSGIYSVVNGTSSFYINGISYNDSWDLETLLERLRSAIKKTEKN
jgi:hypothetical protein